MKAKFFFSAVAVVVAATCLTGCSSKTNSSEQANLVESVTSIVQNDVSSQQEYPTTPQVTDEWRFHYDEKAGGIIIEKCLYLDSYADTTIKSKDTDVIIPTTFEGFEGLNVVGIGANAFNNMVMKSLTIPDTVVSLGMHSFSGTEVIEPLVIPDSVTEIGLECFKHYRGEEVVLPPVEEVGSLMFSFSGVKKVVISEGTKVITDCAFSYCNCLEELVIPNSVEEITDYWGLSGQGFQIEKITLPDNLKIFNVSCLPRHITTFTYPTVVFKGETYDFFTLNYGDDEILELKEKLQQAIDNNA